MITEPHEEMKHLKQSLSKEFKMKDLGELHYCLGPLGIHVCVKMGALYARHSTFRRKSTSMVYKMLMWCLSMD